MALYNRTLTEREKAALYYHFFAGCNDWPLLFRIADNTPFDDKLKDSKNLSDYASKWKRSEKVITFLRNLQTETTIKEYQKRQEIEKDFGESVRTEDEQKRGKAAFVDYSNPENQRKKLNELVNSANDPGEALDALKVIISGQKDDRQAAREQKQVRAYLPLTCQDCPLYQKLRK